MWILLKIAWILLKIVWILLKIAWILLKIVWILLKIVWNFLKTEWNSLYDLVKISLKICENLFNILRNFLTSCMIFHRKLRKGPSVLTLVSFVYGMCRVRWSMGPSGSATQVGAAHAPRNLRPHGPSRAPSIYQITKEKVKQDKKEKKNCFEKRHMIGATTKSSFIQPIFILHLSRLSALPWPNVRILLRRIWYRPIPVMPWQVGSKFLSLIHSQGTSHQWCYNRKIFLIDNNQYFLVFINNYR